ncbi:MAG: PAS domain S-box protein [Pseudomonadota bacterium]
MVQEAALLVDRHGLIEQVNAAFEALSGWTEQELIGQPLDGLYADGEEDTGEAGKSDQSPFGPDGAARRQTHRYRCRTGHFFSGESVSFALNNEDGAFRGSIHVVQDVSRRIRRADRLTALITFVAEQGVDVDIEPAELLDLGCRYFELELGVLCSTDGDRNTIEAVAGELASELSMDDFANDHHFKTILASEEMTAVIGQTSKPIAAAEGGQKETGLQTWLASPIRAVGQRYGTLCFASRQTERSPFDGQQRQILRFLAQWLAARRNARLTNRSHAEANEQLQRSEERHRQFYEKTPAMLHSIDGQGRLTNVSDAWLATMGYRREEVIGRPSTDFLTPESKRFAEEIVLPAYRTFGHCENVPYQFVTKSGDIRDIELSAVSQIDDDGNFIRSLAILLDVTERKQVEQKLLRETAALERSNADLQRFAHVASHDLQEPLRRIITYCEVLKEDHGSELSDEAAEIMGTIQSGGRRLRLMINDLLAYVRVREQLDRTFEPVDMSAVLSYALDDLHDEITSRHACIEVAHLPLVWGRAPLFRMVFHHLLRNAIIHGSEEAPAIDIAVRDAGDVWQFSIADKGIGVEPRFADRIFEIFQRLHHKDEGEGSGAGLAICRLIVQRCGGDIWLDRSYNSGARFLFTLPKEKPKSQELSPPTLPPARSEIDLTRR